MTQYGEQTPIVQMIPVPLVYVFVSLSAILRWREPWCQHA